MGNEVMIMVPVADVQAIAAAIAKSGMFSIKTTEQAFTLCMLAQAEGMHPATAARDYDVIQGRPAKKAEAMMRDFLKAGGKVEWHKLEDMIVDATFSHPQGGTARITWDLKRAIQAGLSGKDTWKKYPRQMLRSRTVSEGIRTVCPMATGGLYEPGEAADMGPIPKEKDMGKADVVDLETGEMSEPVLPDDACKAATNGMASLNAWWTGAGKEVRLQIGAKGLAELKAVAQAKDDEFAASVDNQPLSESEV